MEFFIDFFLFISVLVLFFEMIIKSNLGINKSKEITNENFSKVAFINSSPSKLNLEYNSLSDFYESHYKEIGSKDLNIKFGNDYLKKEKEKDIIKTYEEIRKHITTALASSYISKMNKTYAIFDEAYQLLIQYEKNKYKDWEEEKIDGDNEYNEGGSEIQFSYEEILEIQNLLGT